MVFQISQIDVTSCSFSSSYSLRMIIIFYFIENSVFEISNFLYRKGKSSLENMDSDGWDSSQQIEIVDLDQANGIKFKGQNALNLLNANHRSLQPDMISGWKPKLPSCPLPLSYTNVYVDSLRARSKRNSLYNVIYVGPRMANSVQMNQQYSYFWRYRERYSLNLKIVKEAVQNIGIQKPQDLKISEGSHIFQSNFESGNLDLAIRVKKDQYDCFIRSDTNTKGHSNWYYFKVQNKHQVGPVKLNICNMMKNKNLYIQGMRPYCRVGQSGQWSQDICDNVQYVERLCRYGFDVTNYQIQFTFNFAQPYQEVYFAYSIPYTYSDLSNFLSEIKQNYSHLARVTKLCESLGGIDLPLVIINGSFAENKQNQFIHRRQRKKVAVITARIHPGESNSSYFLEGFVRKLLSQDSQSQILLNNFIFYIVPMLNPDGVIAGNFRTSYSGKDLNRQFNNLNKYIFPQINALTELCQNIINNYNKIEFFFDFHGHSSKKNLFSYGPEHSMRDMYYFKSKAFAKIIEKIEPLFCYKSSIFTISESKKSTARAYMLRKLKIPMSFTFQMSNGLYQDQKSNIKFLTQSIILEAGGSLVKSLKRYAEIEMRMPLHQVKTKIDSGKYKKRVLSKVSKKKFSSTIDLSDIKNKTFRRSSYGTSFIKINNNNESFGQKKEMMELIEEIQTEEILNKNSFIEEGGSDSQGPDEDLSNQQTNDLFKAIINRQNVLDYKKYSESAEKVQKEKLLTIVQEIKSNKEIVKPTSIKRYQSLKSTQRIRSVVRPMLKKTSVQREVVPILQKNFIIII